MDHLPPRSKEGTLKLQQGHRKGRTRPSNLREQVDPQTMAMYPTPTTQEIEHPDMVLNEKGRRMPKNGKTDHSLNLADTVRIQSGAFIKKEKMLPTPNAWDGMRGPRSQKNLKEKNHQINLITALKDNESKKPVHQWMLENKKMYPTPNTNDGATNPAEDIENWEKRAEKKKKEGINLHYALRHAVQKEEQMKMYPTPRANSAMNANMTTLKKMKYKGRLEEKVAQTMFPTPTNSEHKYRLKGNSQSSQCLEAQSRKVGGRLNPQFVQFLMGYPMNWTKIE